MKFAAYLRTSSTPSILLGTPMQSFFARRFSPVSLAAALLLAGFAQAQTAPAQDAAPAAPAKPQPQYPNYPSETPAEFVPVTSSYNYIKRTVMVPMRDGTKLNTIVIIPRNAKNAPMLLTRTPYDANEPGQPRRQLRSRLHPARLRQRRRRHRRRRLHPRGAGRARQIWFGRRLRDEPAAGRPAESDPGRPFHRHLGHHRLAGQECAGVERQGRHHRHFLRRLPALDGAGESASGA